MFAITPNGVGKPVGARRIRDGWPLAEGETFTLPGDTVIDGMVLAADGVSLEPAPPPRRLISKSVIIERLHIAGKLVAAQAALNADAYARERWYAADKPAIYADDAEALALLTAIGADPEIILAP